MSLLTEGILALIAIALIVWLAIAVDKKTDYWDEE
jgi:hypothetical protein